MHDIDFLPAEFRKDHDRIRWHRRRILVLAGVAAMIAAAAWSQRHRARRLEADLASRQPACAAAAQTQETLNELQSQLQLARTSAELVTYLRHPWPRTRILAALLGPLPQNVRFEELEIDCETLPGAKPAMLRSPTTQEEEQRQLAALPPAARDLKRLREQCDSQQTIVIITGVTNDSAALHDYVGALGREDLFSKVQLQSIGIDPTDPKSIRFSVTLVVRAGYGQPGGPCGADPRPLQENRPEDHLARR
jgi:hypothetical protein